MTVTAIAPCPYCGGRVEQTWPLPPSDSRYACSTCAQRIIERIDKIERALICHFAEQGYPPEEEFDTSWRVTLGDIGATELNLTEIAAEITRAIEVPLMPLPSTARRHPTSE